MDMKHPALVEAKDFIRALHGDLRTFNRTLRKDDESQNLRTHRSHLRPNARADRGLVARAGNQATAEEAA
jgi:hypothetical protein